MEKNIDITRNADGNMIVIISNICFKGKRKINWDDVEAYLKQYIGGFYDIMESGDRVYIGSDFADEFGGSNDTARLKGTLAKAKANAVQGIPKLIEHASGKRYKENLADKHVHNAKYGWYRYDSRFALPVYGNNGDVERYNVFRVEILIRHAEDGKMYLYDLVNIKKETSTPFEQ
ncbi:MAG: hypothetical protein K2K70_01775 [Lachnospiraceae bacterium]|nr:hypothetical protein [Lachnospiraceae bacterium]